MNYGWEVLKCNNCGSYHALPSHTFAEEYKNCESKICCPVCGKEFLMYGGRCGMMIANKGMKEIYVLSE